MYTVGVTLQWKNSYMPPAITALEYRNQQNPFISICVYHVTSAPAMQNHTAKLSAVRTTPGTYPAYKFRPGTLIFFQISLLKFIMIEFTLKWH